jgi:hypothetical protein
MITCFNDWKRFCVVLREIAGGDNTRPLASLEAQKRARTVLAECGYSWLGQVLPNVGDTSQPRKRRSDQMAEAHLENGNAPINGYVRRKR